MSKDLEKNKEVLSEDTVADKTQEEPADGAEIQVGDHEEAPISEDKGETTVDATAVVEAKDPIQLLTEERDRLKDDYLRLAAEFDNFRKRTNRDMGNLVRSANEGLIVSLLDILDNFDRSVQNTNDNTDLISHKKGIKLIYDQLLETLGRQGLQKFSSVGEKFDPNLHEAIAQVESDEYPKDTVAIELQPGYKLFDKVIRHARVAVVKEKDTEE